MSRIAAILALGLAVVGLSACGSGGGSGSGIPIDVEIQGHGTVTGPHFECRSAKCHRSYKEDTTVYFTAKPAPGWKFAHWDGECIRKTPVCDVYFGSDSYLAAYFVPS